MYAGCTYQTHKSSIFLCLQFARMVQTFEFVVGEKNKVVPAVTTPEALAQLEKARSLEFSTTPADLTSECTFSFNHPNSQLFLESLFENIGERMNVDAKNRSNYTVDGSVFDSAFDIMPIEAAKQLATKLRTTISEMKNIERAAAEAKRKAKTAKKGETLSTEAKTSSTVVKSIQDLVKSDESQVIQRLQRFISDTQADEIFVQARALDDQTTNNYFDDEDEDAAVKICDFITGASELLRREQKTKDEKVNSGYYSFRGTMHFFLRMYLEKMTTLLDEYCGFIKSFATQRIATKGGIAAITLTCSS